MTFDCFDETTVIVREGYLFMKKGRYSWKKRWCEIYSDHTFVYYNSKKESVDNECLGQMLISNVNVCMINAASSTPQIHKRIPELMRNEYLLPTQNRIQNPTNTIIAVNASDITPSSASSSSASSSSASSSVTTHGSADNTENCSENSNHAQHEPHRHRLDVNNNQNSKNNKNSNIIMKTITFTKRKSLNNLKLNLNNMLKNKKKKNSNSTQNQNHKKKKTGSRSRLNVFHFVLISCECMEFKCVNHETFLSWLDTFEYKLFHNGNIDIVYDGVLSKKGAKNTAFKERYFMLDGNATNARLLYFENRKRLLLKGFIDMKQVFKIQRQAQEQGQQQQQTQHNANASNMNMDTADTNISTDNTAVAVEHDENHENSAIVVTRATATVAVVNPSLCFWLHTRERIWVLSANKESQLKAWMMHIQQVMDAQLAEADNGTNAICD